MLVKLQTLQTYPLELMQEELKLLLHKHNTHSIHTEKIKKTTQNFFLSYLPNSHYLESVQILIPQLFLIFTLSMSYSFLCSCRELKKTNSYFGGAYRGKVFQYEKLFYRLDYGAISTGYDSLQNKNIIHIYFGDYFPCIGCL